MGKRRREDRKYAKRKIIKLLRQLSSSEDSVSSSDSPESDHSSYSELQSDFDVHAAQVHTHPESEAAPEPEPEAQTQQTVPLQIDAQIKNLLGDDPALSKNTGPELHNEIVSRWTATLRGGLEKETRRALLEKYPISKNCLSLKAPVLNEEIQESAPELTKQDNFLAKIQDYIGSILSAIGIPMNDMLVQGDKDNAVLPTLIDASRMLTDLHYSMSLHRKFLIGPSLNANMKKVIESSEIDGYLYGANLAERIKTMQSVKKTSSKLKKPEVRFSEDKKSYHLNYKRPTYSRPRLKMQRGRGDQTQYKSRQAPKSKYTSKYNRVHSKRQ